MNDGPIEIHIEHLILEGFPRGGAQDLGRAVESELRRLVSQRGLPAGLEPRPWIDAGSFPRSAGMPARRIGAQVAHSVYGALGAAGGKTS